ncbi:uncharacterized protein LOC135138766 [Zophobas morio]|uniref:uncharacterized protein LOC135138766 n=1 Tax=Zophobas morio TaxID=2755281 RepID=UPI00308365C6
MGTATSKQSFSISSYSPLQKQPETPSSPVLVEWFQASPQWTSDHKSELLSPKNNCEEPPHVPLAELLDKSSVFPVKFPIESVRCHELITHNIPEDILERNINSVYPVIHEHALHLCATFLIHQKKFGNRDFYQNMSLLDLIDRFLSKRAVSFVGVTDHYMLLDGSEGIGGWQAVGTKDEKPPLTMETCLTYDEMRLSAFLSLSSHTVFINDGKRYNKGIFEDDRAKLEDDGVIMGLIGPRLPSKLVMEHRDIIKTKEQNTLEQGYGNLTPPTWQGTMLEFYGDTNITYEDYLPQMKTNKDRYCELFEDAYFDKLVYCRRIALSIDTLLIEANDRAKKMNKMAYVHVVGLGLGVWRVYCYQDKIFMETFAQRLELLSEVLTNISDVCFAYIAHKEAGEYKHGDKLGNIKLHMENKIGPHMKLVGEEEGKLLVVSYAWDCNALPGNEFWFGSLHTSSDPAAACSTQVAELHNWHINQKASARNLRVATLEGLVTFQKYQEMHKDD